MALSNKTAQMHGSTYDVIKDAALNGSGDAMIALAIIDAGGRIAREIDRLGLNNEDPAGTPGPLEMMCFQQRTFNETVENISTHLENLAAQTKPVE